MELKVIKNKKEYKAYLDWVDELFDKKVSPESREGEELKVALLLIREYEDKYFPVPVPDPIDAIKIKMEEKGLRNKDLVGIIGSKGYISALLNKKKPLSLEIARIFHKELGIPAEVFFS